MSCQVLVKVFHSPNLYWETYSGEVDQHDVVSSGPLYGLVRTAIHVIPFSLMMFPTIYIYYLIIKETSQRTDSRSSRKDATFSLLGRRQWVSINLKFKIYL